MRQNFVNCIRMQLQDARFGKKRQEEVIDRFNGLADFYRAQGNPDPDLTAMSQVFAELSLRQSEKDKRALFDLVKTLERRDRMDQFAKNNAVLGPTNEDANPAYAAMGVLAADPRSGGVAYTTLYEVNKGRLWAAMGDSLRNIRRGFMGTQKGAAHLPNVVREVFGEDTGDAIARDMAKSWVKTTDAAVDLFNSVGGSLNKLSGYHFPQRQNVAKMVQDKAGWFKFMNDAVDWSAMHHPNGAPILASERQGVLDYAYRTLTTNGVSKLDPSAFGGNGKALGNALEAHRFFVYKDANAWLEMHNRYGDGNVFDVMASYIDTMAHRTALVQMFGSNPSTGINHMRALALKAGADAGPVVLAKTEELLKNKFDPMSDYVMRRNPMASNSVGGNLVLSVANTLVSAQLGSASLLAIPGDIATALSVRMLNGMGGNPFPSVGHYLKTFLAPAASDQARIAQQSGFVFDQVVSHVYSMQRFSGTATYGPHVTQVLSESILRAAGLSGHTTAARWAAHTEFMGLMARSVDTTFDNLPFAGMMQRYGIGAQEWDAFRAIGRHTQDGVDFLRPIDLLDTKLKNKEELFNKFQSMIAQEAAYMVPEGTIEGSVALKNVTRPDTLAGAILHSFSMYKNFPVSMMMTYGRLAMANPDRAGRLGFIAGLAASMTLMGALGLQMRELSKGRTPLPMDNMSFVGNAMLSGGALSIWGDFLFSGVNRFGGGAVDTAAGPLAQFTSDVTNLAFGGPFAWASLADEKINIGARSVQFAKRYTPGTSVWWARLALERYLWDALDELADPKVYQRRNRAARKTEEAKGNSYWLAPGTRPGAPY